MGHPVNNILGHVAGNAAIIVFREGLEAVLILASLLASLRTLEERQFRRPLIIGAAFAFVATAITWWVANQLLTVLLPLGERLEAIVSLIAIGVLLLITNWFFHKVYWTGWMANFHARKRRLIGGIAVITISQALGLVILGFTPGRLKEKGPALLRRHPGLGDVLFVSAAEKVRIE